MKLNLSDLDLFNENDLDIDKKINFIFGKNGTGKSTIAELVLKQKNGNCDVKIFQGFESIIGEDKKLNAVVLGEENKQISLEIFQKKERIEALNSEISKIEKEILKPEEKNKENYFTNLERIKKEIDDKNKKIQKFYTEAAKKLCDENLVENSRTYNKKSFEREIPISKLLNNKEYLDYKNILKEESRTIEKIILPKINFEKYIEELNEILNLKVNPVIMIEEFNDNNEKRLFAEKGLHIHNPEDKCAFCGNVVSKNRIEN